MLLTTLILFASVVLDAAALTKPDGVVEITQIQTNAGAASC